MGVYNECLTCHLSCSRWLHLLFNLGVQVVVGLPLEMVHGSLRIAAVYMAGVLAGKFCTHTHTLVEICECDAVWSRSG